MKKVKITYNGVEYLVTPEEYRDKYRAALQGKDFDWEIIEEPERTPKIDAKAELEKMNAEIKALQGGDFESGLKDAFPRFTSQPLPESKLGLVAYPAKQAANFALDALSAPGRSLRSVYYGASNDTGEAAKVASETARETTAAPRGESFGDVASAIGGMLVDPLTLGLSALPSGQLIGATRLGARTFGAESPRLLRLGEAVGKGAAEAGGQLAVASIDRPIDASEGAVIGIAGALTNRYGMSPAQARELALDVAYNRLRPSKNEIKRAPKGALEKARLEDLYERDLLAGDPSKLPERLMAYERDAGGRMAATMETPYFADYAISDDLLQRIGTYPEEVIQELKSAYNAGILTNDEMSKFLQSLPDEERNGVFGKLLEKTFEVSDLGVPAYGRKETGERLAALESSQPLGKDLLQAQRVGADVNGERKLTLKALYDYRKFLDRQVERAGGFSKSYPDLASEARLYRDAREAVNGIISESTDMSGQEIESLIEKLARKMARDMYVEKTGRVPKRESTISEDPTYKADLELARNEIAAAIGEYQKAMSDFRAVLPWRQTIERRSQSLRLTLTSRCWRPQSIRLASCDLFLATSL